MEGMEHRVKITILDNRLFPELQAQNCAVPDSGKYACDKEETEVIRDCNKDKALPEKIMQK